MADASHRDRDMSVEREIGRFLDEHFYKDHVEDFVRFDWKEDQLKGKDVMFTIGGFKDIIVDEKATTHYINDDIPTFAFEISFVLPDGRVVRGWLFDETKETEFYLLIWPFARKRWKVSKDDITRLKCLLISRGKLRAYLAKQGFTKERCLDQAKAIRDNGLAGRVGKEKNPAIYYVHSTSYAEKPINLVVSRDILEALAEDAFEVTPGSVRRR